MVSDKGKKGLNLTHPLKRRARLRATASFKKKMFWIN